MGVDTKSFKKKKVVSPPEGLGLSDDESSQDDSFSLGYSTNNKDFSKPQIVMVALLDCQKKRSVEMRKGYTTVKYDRKENPVVEYIPDSRKTFKSSVDFLRAILAPECEADKAYMEAEEEIVERMDALIETFGYRPYLCRDVVQNEFGGTQPEYFIDKTAEPFIPEPGSTIHVLFGKKLKEVSGGWDVKTHEYLDCLVGLYDEILSEMAKLIARTGDFKRRTRRG